MKGGPATGDCPFGALELHLGRRKSDLAAPVPGDDDPLGAVLSALSRDRPLHVTLVPSQPLLALARALEGEALGRPASQASGSGLQVLVAEPLGAPADYGPERLVVELRRRGEPANARVRRLVAAGVPTVHLVFASEEEEAREPARWQRALAKADAEPAASDGRPPAPLPVSERVPAPAPAPQPEPVAAPVPEPPHVPQPALREGQLALFAAPAHARALEKIAGTLGPLARTSVHHWLAAQLALGQPGEVLSLHFPAADEPALASLQSTLRSATGLAVRARASLDEQAIAPDRAGGAAGCLLFLVSASDPPSLSSALAALRRPAEGGRRALLLCAEDGSPSRALDAIRDAAALLVA
jgi:hypothetical protein